MTTINDKVVPKFLEFGKFRPVMSMTKDNLKEMQQFFLLKIIACHKDGITAYQIQNSYNFPRSNVIRYLGDLSKDAYLQIDEKVLDGRANKFYSLSLDGFNYLASLKDIWQSRFSMMEELTSNYFTEGEKQYFISKIDKLHPKSEKIAYLKKMNHKIQHKIEAVRSKEELLLEMNRQITRIINDMENTDAEFDRTHLEQMFDMVTVKQEEN